MRPEEDQGDVPALGGGGEDRRRPGRASKGAYRMLGRADAQILAFVHWAYLDLGEAHFSKGAYQCWRREQIKVFDNPIPSLDQLKVRYGSFTEAAQRAIPDLPRRRLRQAGPQRIEEQRRVAAPNEGESAARPETVGPTPETGVCLPLLRAMAAQLSVDEVREIERLVRQRLRVWPTRAAKGRAETLGFLAGLLMTQPVFVSPFRAVERKTYDELRPAAAPTSQRLVRAFGSWLGVCRAADGVLSDGRKSRPGTVASRAAYGPRPPTYTRDEVIAAVQRCASVMGRTPSSHNYHCWSIEERARARRHGEMSRLPAYRVICKLFRPETDEQGERYVWAVVVRASGL